MSVFTQSSRSTISASVIGVGLGLAAALMQWLVYPVVGSHMPFAFFLPALAFSAASLGRIPAFAVLLIGALNAGLLAPPTGSFAVHNPQDVAGIVLYGILGTLLVFYAGHLRITTRRSALAEKHLALAQDRTGIGVFELDFQRGTAYVSPGLSQILGQRITSEPIPLQEWLSAIGAQHVEDATRAMQERLYRGEMRYEREQRIELASGRVVWLLNRVQMEATSDGVLAQARGASVDITERKRVADDLMAAKETLREEVLDLKHVHAFSQRLVAAGDNLATTVQSLLELLLELYAVRHGLVSLREPNSARTSVLAHAGFSADEACKVHESGIAGATTNASEDYLAMLTAHRALSQSGGFLDMQSHPLISGRGDVIGAVSVMFAEPHTRSERRVRLCEVCAMTTAAVIEGIRSRAAAAMTERRFSVALESSIVPFSIMAPVRDGDGRIVDFEWTYINAAAARTMGREAQELLGLKIGDMLPRAWEPSGQFDRYVGVVETGEPCQFEVCTQATNRGVRWYNVVASELQGSVAVWFANITDRKLYEEALEAAAKRKDEFLATLAHELRNPLGAIRQGVQISRAMASTEPQKRLGLAVIDRQVTQMSLLLDDLLDVARVGRGTLLLRKSKEVLAVLIDTAIETARPHIEAKHHHLVVDLPRRIILDVDPLRMTQVIANLVVNAAKYTDAGGRIRVSADFDGGVLAIRVRDNGIGLTKEQIDQVFDMYAQIPAALEKSQGGLGIGLALARGLIELHDGSITANSAGPGQGAEFIVRLPRSCATVEDAPVAPHAATAQDLRSQVATILIADDNRDAADSLAELLRLDGHQVHVAYDGDEALQAYAQVVPDVALLDMDMPGLSGAELARAIRQHPVGVPTLLIAVTGRGQAKDRELALRAGFDHHLTKPMDPERIQSLIEIGLGARSAQPRLA
jgi:signal transduction histidine kinase/CheY-like chemotaxis protein